VEQRNIDPSSHHPPQKVKGTSVPVPTPPSEKQRDRTVFPTSFQLEGHMSTLTGPSYHSSGGSSPSSGNSANAEIHRIKKATRAIPHRYASAAIDCALYAYHTDGIPGHDDPAVPIPGRDILPDLIPGRADNWITRGVYESKMPNRPNRLQMFPAQHQWNGEPKTFDNYAFNLSGWAMQSGMGYLFETDFVHAYHEGDWAEAKYVAKVVTDAQFKQDNTVLYGALMSSTHNRARRYLLDSRATMDGLKVWLKLRDKFDGETNVLHQTIQFLKHLD
jgi:hypothetical protein